MGTHQRTTVVQRCADMKILMLSEPTFPEHPGGSGKTSHLLAAALVARGHRVHLVSMTQGETRQETRDGVDVLRLADAPPRPPHQTATTWSHSIFTVRWRKPSTSRPSTWCTTAVVFCRTF